jgi:hypothetical protein
MVVTGRGQPLWHDLATSVPPKYPAEREPTAV